MKLSVESITKAIRGDGWTDNSKGRLVNNKGGDGPEEKGPNGFDSGDGSCTFTKRIMNPLMI